MTRQRSIRLVLSVATLVAAACSESPDTRLSPATHALSASKTGTKSKTAGRGSALPTDIARSVTVDRRGGKLEIREAGLKLTIPPNALPSGLTSLTIKVTAMAGDQYAYEFEPSGTTFTQPLKFEQDIGDLNLSPLAQGSPTVSYFKSRDDISNNGNNVVTFEDLLTSFDLSGHKVKADVWHFSGYIVCWGRK
jgi:hypothetical protein